MYIYDDKYKKNSSSSNNERYSFINKFYLDNSTYIPNLLIYGKRSSGKASLLYNILNYPLKKKFKIRFDTPSKEVSITCYKAKNIIEIDILELDIYDKFFFRDYFKELIVTKNVSNNKIKIIVFHNLEYMSYESQIIFQNLIKSYYNNVRFILLCNNLNKVSSKIIDIFICIRLEKLSNENILDKVLKKLNNKNIKIPISILNRIIKESDYDYEETLFNIDIYLKKKKIVLYNYKNLIKKIYKIIYSNKIKKINYESISSLVNEIRLDYDIEYGRILIYFFKEILKNKLSDEDIFKIIKLTHIYDNLINIGTNSIIHLESYFFKLIDMNIISS